MGAVDGPSPKSTFELVNDFIIALSHLLWPILALVIILLFKKELSHLLHRIKKGKILGQEIELENEINEFNAITSQASESIVPDKQLGKESNDNPINSILINAETDPKIGIILLSAQIEKEMTDFISSSGLLNEFRPGSIRKSFELLSERGFISNSILRSVEIFWNLRNKIIHGKYIDNEDQLIRVLDIGVSLLNTLKSIPRAKYIVYKLVDIFSDSEGKSKIPDAMGIILEAHYPEDKIIYQVFPTSRLNYKINEQVAWEWSFDKVWNKSWYVNPQTNKIQEAWHQAAEFVGRPITET